MSHFTSVFILVPHLISGVPVLVQGPISRECPDYRGIGKYVNMARSVLLDQVSSDE